jgi:anti-sigma-K factor RskA
VTEHREEYIELCAGYALGSMDAADRERLEQHLSTGCPVCEAALADFSAATVMLAASAEPARAPDRLRARVLDRIASTPQEAAGGRAGSERDARWSEGAGPRVLELRPRRGAPAWAVWVPALAAAAFAVTTALLWNDVSRLRGELATRRTENTDLASRLAEQERLNEVLSAPGAKVAVLEITPQGEQALRARATYDPASRNAVVIFENFKAPSGHDYQLWALEGATPRNLGVIKTDEAGRAVIRLDDAGDPGTLAAFAVSLEQAGGSPNPAAPTGPVVMLGKLGG